jgi:hypothetical protein
LPAAALAAGVPGAPACGVSEEDDGPHEAAGSSHASAKNIEKAGRMGASLPTFGESIQVDGSTWRSSQGTTLTFDAISPAGGSAAFACIRRIHEASATPLDNPCRAAVLSLTMTVQAADSTPDTAAPADTCAQCARTLTPGDTVAAGDRLFCRVCYESLRAEIEAAVAMMSADVNYAQAAVGAALGGVAGALAWWGFTVLTHIAFGLFAVAIGYLVGHGTVRFAGGKRSRGLQALSVAVSLLSYLFAVYLVNMTFINQAFVSRGESFRVGFSPQSLDLLVRVVTVGFGAMDLVFLAIVVYEAWKIPRPVALPPRAAA